MTTEQGLMDAAHADPIGAPVAVLDHGYVKYIDHMGTDESIIEAARMSTGKGFMGWEPGNKCERCGEDQNLDSKACPDGVGPHAFKPHKGDANTLEFMWKNRHSTPFEMCELAIEVQAPIMVFREWHRHRTQSYSEFSARYAQMPDLHYLPDVSRIQRQSATNKQGSAEAFDEDYASSAQQCMTAEQSLVYSNYDLHVRDGMAKEVARLNTPVSRYSKMRAKTDLLNWLNFLRLRMAPNAMWEIRQYAWAVAGIVKKLWPRTWALFEEHDLHGVRLSRTEIALLAKLHDDTKVEATCGAHNELLNKLRPR